MKYLLQLHSKPDLPIAEKHLRLLHALQRCHAPWRIDVPFPLPAFGTDFRADSSFKPYWPKFLKGMVSYRYRRLLQDWHGDDDYLHVEFTTRDVDVGYLLREVLPALITAFDAYWACVVNEETTYVDFKSSRNKNHRSELFRFYPVCFLGADLCQRALGLTCAEVKARLEHQVEHVDLRDEGVYYVSRFVPLSLEETNTIDLNLASAMTK